MSVIVIVLVIIIIITKTNTKKMIFTHIRYRNNCTRIYIMLTILSECRINNLDKLNQIELNKGYKC